MTISSGYNLNGWLQIHIQFWSNRLLVRDSGIPLYEEYVEALIKSFQRIRENVYDYKVSQLWVEN